MESEPMLPAREKSPLPESQRRIEPTTLHYAGQRAQHTADWAILALRVWFKLGMMIDTIVLYILILVYLILIFIQGHKSARKQKLLRQLSHKVEFGELLRHVGVVMHILICLVHLPIKEGNPTYVILFRKFFNKGLLSDIYWQISFKLGMMIQTTKLSILISVWMTLTFIQDQLCEKSKTLMSIYSQILSINLDEIHCVATACCFVEYHAILQW